jgi:hypothetical protein
VVLGGGDQAGLLLMNLRSAGNTTVRAGRLIPAAIVSVDTTNLISRSSASCSTSCLYLGRMPA